MLVGLISDTHGLVRPQIFEAFKDVELVLHAGDVGGDDVLDELSAIAPIKAVCGNTDEPENPRLQNALDLILDGVRVHVSHGHEVGAPTPEKLFARYAADVVVYGHTHKQLVVQADGRWAVNPGAAGARRFKLEPSVGRMTIRSGRVEIEIVGLDDAEV